MIKAFKEDRDIYASIASLAFKLPYENCLEFHPGTGEYQPDGKKRRGQAKLIVLGKLLDELGRKTYAPLTRIC